MPFTLSCVASWPLQNTRMYLGLYSELGHEGQCCSYPPSSLHWRKEKNNVMDNPIFRALGAGKGVADNPLPSSFSSWYYCLHVCSILVLLLLPVKKSQRRTSTQENVHLSQAKKFDERDNPLGQNSFSTMNNVCNQNRDTGSRHSSLTQWLRERVTAVSRLWTEASLEAFAEPLV